MDALVLSPLFDPGARSVPVETLERLAAFAARWSGREGTEQQLSQSFLNELCDALGTARPYAGDEWSTDDFCFEKRVDVPDRSERGRIDMYKRGHFVLEAKCGRNSKSSPGSAPVRGSKQYMAYIQDAYLDQAKVYAALLPEGPPPLLVVVDIGHRFWIWRGTGGRFDAFHSPRRIEFGIDELAHEENARALWACFESPADLDPSRAQQRITEEAAEKLAPLAAELEASGHTPEEVARFLMRCLFCMFAEDVDLLPAGHFSRLLESSLKLPAAFAPEATSLFKVMDTGGLYGFEPIRRFNGALFRNAEALPLDARSLGMLADAAALNWAYVDPAIFGTLLERALDPRERHRLGAHYTPRVFVERIVRATIEEPLRAEWEVVQARAEEVRASEPDSDVKANEAARKVLLPFLRRLHDVRVLDPACGTANFLYVAYAVLKELEHEVLSELALAGGGQMGISAQGAGTAVVPSQMLGIEVKPWAAEIAQLVLWIGHLQWELFHHRKTAIRDPILPEERSIECRDALIEWERAVERVGSDGAVVTRWDGITTRVHHATGKEVPDTDARAPVFDYVGVRRARWPEATFIVGNPPFIGNKHMREVLGDAYTEAVRTAYADEVPNTVDLVMYWFHRTALAARQGTVERFGLITTNSIVQAQNRQVTERHLAAEPPLGIVAAVPDHPWVDAGADVRIAMTVAERSHPGLQRLARLGRVSEESAFETIDVEFRTVRTIHADLSTGANVAAALPLRANEGLSFQGMNLVGKGFRLTPEEVLALGFDLENLPPIIRPYLNAREFMQRREGRYVVDAFGLTVEALQKQYPTAFQWLYDHVKPERDLNRRSQYAKNWWIFGEARGRLRTAIAGLSRFIATPRTSKHRVFEFFHTEVVPDCKLVAVAFDDAYHLGVLSSRAHSLWAIRSGGRLGVGNDPTYDNGLCFLTFPFPAASDIQRRRIRTIAEQLDEYRKQVRERNPAATLTAMYNLLEKHRAHEPFSPAEREFHFTVGTDELMRLHDDLDRAVFDAYGWPQDLDDESLLERLVELNAERAAEEKSGLLRWLRQDSKESPQQGEMLSSPQHKKAVSKKAAPWPSDPLDQLADLLALMRASSEPLAPEAVASHFARAPRKRVSDLLERLAVRRLLVADDRGHYRAIG